MERERITISIKKNVLKSIDDYIDGIRIRNRSHAIETLAMNALKTGKINNALVLLGGEDALKRISQVKETLSILEEKEFQTVYVAIGYLGDKIKQKLGDGSEYGLKLKYIEGEGSGGAIRAMKNIFIETFLVFNFTNSLNVEIDKILDFHRKCKLTGTIATDDISNFSGIYIFEPKIFDFLPKGFSMLENDIFPKMLEEKEIVVYPVI